MFQVKLPGVRSSEQAGGGAGGGGGGRISTVALGLLAHTHTYTQKLLQYILAFFHSEARLPCSRRITASSDPGKIPTAESLRSSDETSFSARNTYTKVVTDVRERGLIIRRGTTLVELFSYWGGAGGVES